jgi:phosphatidylcholine synthase
MIAIAANFEVPVWVTAGLCAIGVYILLSDVLIRLMGGTRA